MTEAMAYVASCPGCNRTVVVMVDTPDAQRENAKELAKCIRQGYIIERISVEAFRERPIVCSCKRRASKKGQTQNAPCDSPIPKGVSDER